MCVEVWSYSFLIERAVKIAAYLRCLLDVCGPSVVAIYGSSSPEVLSAVLGVLAVPGAYMPMDLHKSAGAHEMLLRRHHASIVVVELALVEGFLSQGWKLSFTLHTQIADTGFIVAQICQTLDRASPMTRSANVPMTTNPNAIQELLHSYSEDIASPCCLVCTETRPHTLQASDMGNPVWPFPSVSPCSLAYVLHTSGTTGEPKAVRVPHCCIVPNVLGLGTRFSVHPDDIVLNAAPLTFDPSVVEIFMALFSGSALLVVPSPLRSSASLLSRAALMRQHVTLLQATPSLVQRLAEGPLGGRLLGPRSNLRVLALGGESFPGAELVPLPPGGGDGGGDGGGVCDGRRGDGGGGDDGGGSDGGGGDGGGGGSDGVMVERIDVSVGKGEVPIGEPLLGTLIELRTEEGPLEGCGWGQIWIGGVYRTCLLGDEEELVPGCMRPSGDIGYRDNLGRVYCVGRLDQQLKRAGHRVYLNTIQQVLSRSLDSISSCAVVSVEKKDIKHFGWREMRSVASDLILLLFVVPMTPTSLHSMTPTSLHPMTPTSLHSMTPTSLHSMTPTSLHPMTPTSLHSMTPTSLHSMTPTSLHSMTPTSSHLAALFHSIHTRMGQLLPSHCIPDDIIFVREIPISGHGKVDTRSLLDHLPSYLLPLDSSKSMIPSDSTPLIPSDSTPLTPSELQAMLIVQASEVLGLGAWPPTSSLLGLGADSFGVVRMTNEIERRLGARLGGGASPSLPPPRGSADAQVTGGAKRRAEGDVAGVFPSAKRTHIAPALLSWSRGACLGGRAHLLAGVQGGEGVGLGTSPLASRGMRCVLGHRWAVDTGKCVDSSPLVVCQEGTPPMVYCGSHSGVFVGVALHSGEVRWRRKLSDRVESSACLCGEFVCVGCYDGCFYVLNRHDGDIHWCFQVPGREPVKSSPAVDPAKGWVWFGSHDQHLYCLDVLGKKVVFQLHLGGGSCFSSPCVAIGNRILYAATLGGAVVAVDMDVGVVLWRFECPKPIFSSSCALPGGGVAVGCVDGSVYMIDKEGHMIGSYHTSGPVFSSCCCVTGLPPVLPGNDSASDVTEPCDHQVTGSDTASEPCDHGMNTMVPTTRPDALRHIGDLGTALESHPPASCPIGPRYLVYCGSHDKCVYCWDDQLHLVWKREVASEVYSIPFQAALVPDPTDHTLVATDHSSGSLDAGRLASSGHRVPCLCVCAVSGQVYVLHASSGALLGHMDLPGQVYSSPVLVDDLLVVGCRDNNLYCMGVTLCSN
ncbi:hypothetical protein EMCRGX_G019026 [Ephydatia muelleri]